MSECTTLTKGYIRSDQICLDVNEERTGVEDEGLQGFRKGAQ